MIERFGIIGYPVAHSMSPRLFHAAYCGKYPYDLIEEESFDKAWERFAAGYKAVNVTAPFKVLAASRADVLSPEVERIGAANILVNTPNGVRAYNSDYLGVKALLPKNCGSIAVIGLGGAGKAALAAAQDICNDVRVYHHDQIAGGVEADIIIYTLPKAVDGMERLNCRLLLEANYKDPCLANLYPDIYVPGTEWLVAQAVAGYESMTGERPDALGIRKTCR